MSGLNLIKKSGLNNLKRNNMTQGEMFSDLALEQQYENMLKELGTKYEIELEEAALINYKELYEGEPLTEDVPIDAFIKGAMWQKQISYTEE